MTSVVSMPRRYQSGTAWTPFVPQNSIYKVHLLCPSLYSPFDIDNSAQAMPRYWPLSRDEKGNFIFHSFGQLPPELQIRVWRFASQDWPEESKSETKFVVCLKCEAQAMKSFFSGCLRGDGSDDRLEMLERGDIRAICDLEPERHSIFARIQPNYLIDLTWRWSWEEDGYRIGLVLQTSVLLSSGKEDKSPALIIGSSNSIAQRGSSLPLLMQTCYLSRVTALQKIKIEVKALMKKETENINQTLQAEAAKANAPNSKHEMVLAVVEEG